MTYPSVACLVALGAMTAGVPRSGSNRRDVLWNERNLARCLEATAADGVCYCDREDRRGLDCERSNDCLILNWEHCF